MILIEYLDYNNVFLADNVAKLLKQTKINHYTIKLKKDKQLFFRPFYILKVMELEILKTYIKLIWLITSFEFSNLFLEHTFF